MRYFAFLLFTVSALGQSFTLRDQPFLAVKRMPLGSSIVVSNNLNASALSNYPVSVGLTYQTGMQADFSDLRFFDTDGHTPLSYYLDSKTNSTSATVWVKIPSIGASTNKTISMRWGRTITSASSGTATFSHFNDYSPNTPANYQTMQTDGAWYGYGDPISWYGSPLASGFAFHRPQAIRYSGTHNRTYYCYGGYNTPDFNERIAYYDHTTKTFSAPVTIAPFPNGATTDTHANPAMAIDANGYIYIVYGSETSAYLIRHSTNPEDISSWSASTQIDLQHSEYANPFFVGTNLYVFCRYKVSDVPYIKSYGFWYSTNNGANWNTRTNVIQFTDPSNIYGVVATGPETPMPSIHIAFSWWRYVDDTHMAFTNLYHTVSYDGGATWKKMDGTTLTLPITESTADQVANTGAKYCLPNDIMVDGSGAVHILSAIGTPTAVNNFSGPFGFYHHAWNGSAWTSNTVASTADHFFDQARWITNSPSNFSALTTLEGRYLKDGGALQSYNTTDGGTTWTPNGPLVYMPTLSQHSYPQMVRNGTSDFPFYWSHGDASPVEILAFGDAFHTNVFSFASSGEWLYQTGPWVFCQATNALWLNASTASSTEVHVYTSSTVGNDVRYQRVRFNPYSAGNAYRFIPLQWLWSTNSLNVNTHWACGLLWYSAGLHCQYNSSDGGSVTTTQLTATTPTANTWYTIEMWLTGNKTYVRVVPDGGAAVYDNNITTRDYSANTLYVAFGQYVSSSPGTVSGIWDNWIARKYSSPEPTATVQ